VNSIAQTSSYQLARTDVRVNSLCPGIIETGMTKGQFDYARGRGTEHKIGQLNPLGRYGIPQGKQILARATHSRGELNCRDCQRRPILGFG
jgi:NAD(P)-dependent dehydrogenase (short-subunit alcohol dehydrogenase family)